MNATIATVVLGTCVHAETATVERSEDFSVFWPQLRTALLTSDVEALDELSLSTLGIPFGYDSLDPANACDNKLLKAYLQAKLDFFYQRPGRESWREFLEKTPVLDLNTHPDVIVNGIGEYSVGLKVRFAKNHIDGAWDLVDMLDDRARVVEMAESAVGEVGC